MITLYYYFSKEAKAKACEYMENIDQQNANRMLNQNLIDRKVISNFEW
jgi:hypothetical protein